AASRATVKLSEADSLPNKDFLLRYRVVGPKPAMAVLAHTGSDKGDSRRVGGGYFMLMIQPQEDERLAKSPPRELVFLVDVSGSMSGEPTAKVVEAMQHMLKLCRPHDTVQVITFANQAQKLFDKPLPVNGQNIERALQFTSGLQGRGGTEMLKGVKLALDEPIDPERVRIVVMLTDGYIGNEAEIIEHVGRRGGDQVRFWCIGIGSSPNMFLVDGVARQGGGMGKQLGLNDDAAALCQEVISRIQRAQLAKIRIDWGGLAVAETYPARIPDLWAGGPVVLLGRYAGGGQAVVSVSGTVEGEPVRWPLEVTLPADEPAHDVLAKTWARRKIEELMQQTFYQGSPAVEEEVTAIALDYRLMSQYTSFVAVDEREAGSLAEPAEPPRRMLVPVPLPAGTRWEGFFGPQGESDGDHQDLAKAWPRSVQRRSEALYAGRSLTARMLGYRGRGGMAAAGGMGGAGFGVTAGDAPQEMFSTTLPVLRVRLADDSDSMELNVNRALGAMSEQPTWLALAPQAEALVQRAEAAAKLGGELQKKGRLEEARAAFSRSWLLHAAAAERSAGAGEQAANVGAALEEIHAAQVRGWVKGLPALGQKLDLVIRDQSVPEALAAVAGAAQIDIQLLPGSVEDAAALLDRTEVRVGFVDLRGATAAQALDW
ncbi:MAG: VWA domain-containing protein, partial [Pirellulales bacterium]